jgi:hypothetical protein
VGNNHLEDQEGAVRTVFRWILVGECQGGRGVELRVVPTVGVSGSDTRVT